MAPDTLNHAPPLELSDRREIEDLAGGDPVSAIVGREGYLTNVQVDGCLPPAGRGPRESATFDRSYYSVEGEERVLADVLPGGSKVEVAEQEAQRRCAEKTAWCAERKIRYICFIDPTLAPYS
jgi:hypothetical protein